LQPALRHNGRDREKVRNQTTVPTFEVDRVYMMLDDRSPMDDARTWRNARRPAAALADQFVLDGIELAIVEGTFWMP
jgi:hypothetical protein